MKPHLRPLSKVMLVLPFTLALLGATCDSDLPDDAYGRKGDPLPIGAKQISDSEFTKYQANGQVKLLNADQEQSDDEAARNRSAQVHQAVDAFLEIHPELTDRFKGAVDTSLAKPTISGDFEINVDPKCTGSSCATVRTLGTEATLAVFAHAITQYPLAENQIGIYSVLLGNIQSYNKQNPNSPILYIGNYAIASLPSVDAVAKMNPVDRDKVLQVFADPYAAKILAAGLRMRKPNYANPDDHLTQCFADVGFGKGSDHNHPATPCNVFAADGVMANYDFMLKPDLTCIKDQGSRGTCWAFAVASMLESAYARDHQDVDGRPIYKNLSEQHLVGMAKRTWEPSVDGLDDSGYAGLLGRIVTASYRMPYEREWNYNPSIHRIENWDSYRYTHSCDDYTETCSDTTHQGGFFCADRDDYMYCGYVLPAADYSGGIQPTAWHQLWDHTNIDRSIANMILAASFNTPMMAGVMFSIGASSPPHGWVRPPASTTPRLGGHAMHVVGYISNETIAATPALASQLHDETTGGGYFIVRNSWGTCYGDAGYLYMPVSWMRARVIDLEVLDGIN